MSKFTKVFIWVVTHLIAFSIGGSIAFSYFKLNIEETLVEANQFANQTALLGRFYAFVEVQRENGGTENYRKALQSFLVALDQANTMESPVDNEQVILTDKMFAYERLSRIENELGNNEAEEEYEQLALETCEKIKMKNCSYEKISMLSKKLEENGFFSK